MRLKEPRVRTSSRLLLIVGGGTGGHLRPGLNLRDAWVRAHPDWRVEFVLAGRPIESRFLGEHDGQHLLFPGQVSRPPLHRADLYGHALHHMRQILVERKPDLLILLGGYVSLIAALASGGIPYVVLESNCALGKSLHLASPFARRVFLQWPLAEGSRRSAERCRVTGMPLSFQDLERREDARLALGLDADCLTLLVAGGSQGAQFINQRVTDALPVLASHATVQVLHVTGPADLERVEAAYASHPGLGKVLGFSDRMDLLYAAADLVICRAGGMTVAEIAVAGRAAVFVPYPHHRDRHQERNARQLVDQEAGWLLRQSEWNDSTVRDFIVPLLFNRGERQRRAENAGRLGRRDAADRIVGELETLLGSAGEGTHRNGDTSDAQNPPGGDRGQRPQLAGRVPAPAGRLRFRE